MKICTLTTFLLVTTSLICGCSSNHWGIRGADLGYDKNTKFEINDDAYLYCYLGEEFSILPHDYHFRFSMDEFKKDASVGIIDADRQTYVVGIVPEGTIIVFDKIEYKYEFWANDSYYLQYATSDAPMLKGKELSVWHMLDATPKDKYVRVISPQDTEK